MVSLTRVIQKHHTGSQNWIDNLERPWLRKMDMRFGTWNVRSLYRAGALGLVTSEIDKYRMDLVGIREDNNKYCIKITLDNATYTNR